MESNFLFLQSLLHEINILLHFHVLKEFFQCPCMVMVQVHITDGIQFLRDVAASKIAADGVNPNDRSCSYSSDANAEEKWIDKIGLLIVDVDSSDSRYMQIFLSLVIIIFIFWKKARRFE